MDKELTRQQTIERFKKISGTLPPIIVGVEDEYLQKTIQLIIAEFYLEGYRKGKKKYKRFKTKFVKAQKEIERLNANNESLQEKQIATANRFGFITSLDNVLKKQEENKGE